MHTRCTRTAHSFATDVEGETVEPLSAPVGGVFTDAMHYAKPPGGRTHIGMQFQATRAPREMLWAAGPHQSRRHTFDFETMADQTFLRAFFAAGGRPHLLVQASMGESDLLTARIASWAPAPIHLCDIPGPLRLPDAPVTTLVIRDVSRLSVPQQIELSDWMSHMDTQVISVSSVPLRRLVESGRFLQGLFDRLSALQVKATRGLGVVGRAS